ncbi:MAG: hypothetical protein J1E64_02065 [Acetatifactor sp.]|nr:hypothetical protein [Acetatifactor sp.]
MKGMKKAMAIALAAAMTMGSTLTVFAAETGSGSTSGQGENEGHVEKEVINVVLPTVPETTGSPFEYITDPERLIQATEGARYGDYKFPDANEDTGVYFLVGEKEYANTSSTLQVINKSSCDVTITVAAKATASAGGKDLALNTTVSSGDAAAPLYLSLKVGQTDQAISTTEATVVKTIEGNEDNFEVQYTGGGYEYVPKVTAYSWKALEISLSGAVSKDAVVTNDTTAPTVDVTWAFAKAADGTVADTTEQVVYEDTGAPGIISITDFIKVDPKPVVIQFSTGLAAQELDVDGVTLLKGSDKAVANAATYSVDMARRTVTINADAGYLNSAKGNVPIQLVLTKGGKTVQKLNGSITVLNDYPAEAPAIISITDYVKNQPVVITFSLGTKDLAVDADNAVLYQTAGRVAVNTSKYKVDMVNHTVTIDGTASFLTGLTTDLPIYLAFTKGGSEVAELTGTIKLAK